MQSQPHALFKLYCKLQNISFLVRLFLFHFKYRRKRKKRSAYNISNYFHQMSQVNSLRTSKCQKIGGRGYSAHKPQLTCSAGFATLDRARNQFSDFFSFLLTCLSYLFFKTQDTLNLHITTAFLGF